MFLIVVIQLSLVVLLKFVIILVNNIVLSLTMRQQFRKLKTIKN